ncbi:TPA: hypothetical protein H1012_04415 [archaeon]|nr:hypothetical protein [Candidatus Naiadarchaeales archaeon SRR2090159.bin1288]
MINSLPYLKKYITFQKVKLDDLLEFVKKFFDGVPVSRGTRKLGEKWAIEFDGRAGIITETSGENQYGLDYAFNVENKNYILRVTIVRNKHHGNISHIDFGIFSRDEEDLSNLLEAITIELSDYVEQQTSRKEVILESREQKQSAEDAIDEAIRSIANTISARHNKRIERYQSDQ